MHFITRPQDSRAEAVTRPVTQRAIAKVILGGFTLVILLLLVAGLLALRNISSIRSTNAELLDEQLRTQELLDAVLREQRAINAIYANFAKHPDELGRDQLLAQLAASDRQIESIAADTVGEPAQLLWQDIYRAVTHFSYEARALLDNSGRRGRPLRELMEAHQNVLQLVDKLVEYQGRRSVYLKQQLEEISGRFLRQSAFLLGASLLLALICAVYTVRWTVILIRQLEWQAGELSRVSWNLLEKQETTARRFSHELHDELGQSLTAVKANLVALSAHPNGGRPQLDDCLHLVDEAIANVRELSQLLRPTILDDFGLQASLRWLCDRFKQRTSIDVALEADLDVRLADETETHLFRIVQEALTNVARHAAATRVEVTLRREGGKVSLRVADNGKGLAEDVMRASRGLGIVGMRARARSIGGELKVQTPGSGGVEILASFPFIEREEAVS